jgi:hypothetical protein
MKFEVESDPPMRRGSYRIWDKEREQFIQNGKGGHRSWPTKRTAQSMAEKFDRQSSGKTP